MVRPFAPEPCLCGDPECKRCFPFGYSAELDDDILAILRDDEELTPCSFPDSDEEE